VKWAQCDKALH